MNRKLQKKFQKGKVGLAIPVIIGVVILGFALVILKAGLIPNSIIPNSKLGVVSGNWTETGAVIPGAFADADVVDLENGKFRMYYSAEPETPGFNGQVYSAISSDGLNWSQDNGTRLTF